jgi:hypothetical protein
MPADSPYNSTEGEHSPELLSQLVELEKGRQEIERQSLELNKRELENNTRSFDRQLMNQDASDKRQYELLIGNSKRQFWLYLVLAGVVTGICALAMGLLPADHAEKIIIGLGGLVAGGIGGYGLGKAQASSTPRP